MSRRPPSKPAQERPQPQARVVMPPPAASTAPSPNEPTEGTEPPLAMAPMRLITANQQKAGAVLLIDREPPPGKNKPQRSK